MQLAWEKNKSTLFIIVFKNLLSALIPLVNIAGIGIVIDALMTGKSKNQIIYIIALYSAINIAISLTQTAFSYFESKMLRISSDKFQYDYMKDAVLINYHSVQDGFIWDMRTKSMGANPVFSLDHVGEFVNYIVKFAGILYIFSILSPLFIILIAATSCLSIFLTFRLRKIDSDLSDARVEDDRKLDYLYKVMVRYEYAKDVRINSADSLVLGKYKRIFSRQMKMIASFFKRKNKVNGFLSVIAVFQSAMMYAYFSYQVFSGTLSIAQYSVLLASTTLLTSILLGFFDNMALLGRILDKTELYLEYKNLIRQNSDISGTNQLPLRDIDYSHFTICFEHVSFTYPDGNAPVLNNINLTIHGGEKIGIVGLNGSGKTSLVKLLLRIYTPTSGKITLNGVDIQTIPLRQYINMVGVVLQDYTVFAYSLKDNIVFDGAFDEEKLLKCIEKSGLSERARKLPNGIDTAIYRELDDSGIELSGGEGQKLALARAMYKESRLLILDEPTSNLDPIAEYEFFQRLSDFSGGKPTLFISHRLSSTRFCDRILVLENGSVIEQGSHDELIEKDGIYAKLFMDQAKYYKAGVK